MKKQHMIQDMSITMWSHLREFGFDTEDLHIIAEAVLKTQERLGMFPPLSDEYAEKNRGIELFALYKKMQNACQWEH